MNVQGTEVLTFQHKKSKIQATVVTDGMHHCLYTATGRVAFRSIFKAIAWLESHNYNIVI